MNRTNAISVTVASVAILLALGLIRAEAAETSEHSGQSSNAMLDLSMAELFDIPVYSRPLLGVHHAHPRGELMLAYSNRHMKMQGNRDGTTDLSTADVLAAGFMVAPTDMSMHMHMFEAMYGVTDDLTLMVMLPYTEKEMDHVNGMGMVHSKSR